jgi:DNA-binding protein H-NS
MALKNTVHQNLTDQQRLEHLARLCEELQAAVDRAGDHRRLLEDLKQTAQELLTDAETRPNSRKKGAREKAK